MKLSLFFLLLSSYLFTQEIVISEKFMSGIPSDWKVTSDNNKRNWIHKTYKETSYIQMSAYGGKGKSGYKVKTGLHSPLLQPSEKTCKLRFVFADAFQNGQPLQVLLSNENYKPLRSLPDTAWKDLVNNASTYDNNYENTEWIPIPKVKEPYRISFVYNSRQDKKIVTTLIQLREVDVWCE